MLIKVVTSLIEKDNKEIAKLLQKNPASAKKYPKCMLCKENEGFLGTLTHPARGNLRTISTKLGGEDWFLQYSPSFDKVYYLCYSYVFLIYLNYLL